MPLAINCPACASPFRVTDKMRGRKVLCPGCGQALVITSGGTAKRDEGPRAAQALPPRTLSPKTLLFILVGALILVAGGVALVFIDFSGDKSDDSKKIATNDRAADPADKAGAGDDSILRGKLQKLTLKPAKPAPPSVPQPAPQLAPQPAPQPAPKPAPPPVLKPAPWPVLPTGPAAVATYFFKDTLAAQETDVPALAPTDPLGQNGFETTKVFGNSRRVYRFTGNASPGDQQAGLSFDNSGGLLPSDNYSIEIVFAFLQNDDHWRRIVDVQDRQSDDGFYADPSNHLQVYPLPGEGKLITAGGFHHVVLTVVDTGAVKAYLDGTLQFTGSTTVMNINNPRNVVHFFLDNTAGPGQFEFSNGKIALLRLYKDVLSDEQVARLASLVRGNQAAAAANAPLRKDVAADPGSLVGLQNQVGKTYSFRVTGSASGAVWGTDVYTADSTLAAAAVHAGVLQAGETKVVAVKLVPGPSAYTGSTRNGVTSAAWGAYPTAYTVSPGDTGPKQKR